jgi:quinol monooxygenase YgiN
MSAFVQMVEMSTSRIDEMRTFNEEWRAKNPDRLFDWSIVAQDRDNPGKYVAIVHFENYDVAMKNSDDPRTAEYAAKMQELSDGPVEFKNLDVVMTEGM